MEPNNNPRRASRNLHNKPNNNKNYKNSRKKDNDSNNSISFSKHSNNYHSETEKLVEKNKYGKNNTIYYSNNTYKKEDSKSSHNKSDNSNIIIKIKVLLNLVLTTQKIDHSFNHSFVIDSYQLNIKKKEGLESKFDILNDNIKQFVYKVDTERIESKRQHRELINQLYKDRKELKYKHSQFMNEIKQDRALTKLSINQFMK